MWGFIATVTHLVMDRCCSLHFLLQVYVFFFCCCSSSSLIFSNQSTLQSHVTLDAQLFSLCPEVNVSDSLTKMNYMLLPGRSRHVSRVPADLWTGCWGDLPTHRMRGIMLVFPGGAEAEWIWRSKTTPLTWAAAASIFCRIREKLWGRKFSGKFWDFEISALVWTDESLAEGNKLVFFKKKTKLFRESAHIVQNSS